MNLRLYPLIASLISKWYYRGFVNLPLWPFWDDVVATDDGTMAAAGELKSGWGRPVD